MIQTDVPAKSLAFSRPLSSLNFGSNLARHSTFPSYKIKELELECHFCKIVLEETNPVIRGVCARCATSYEDLDLAYLTPWKREVQSRIAASVETLSSSTSIQTASTAMAENFSSSTGASSDGTGEVAADTLPFRTATFENGTMNTTTLTDQTTVGISTPTTIPLDRVLISGGSGFSLTPPVYVTGTVPKSIEETLEKILRALEEQNKLMAQAQFRPFAAPASKPKEEPTPMTEKPKTVATESADETPAPSRLAALKTAALDEGSDAAWRMAGTQFVKLAKEPMVAALSRNLGPGDEALRGKIAAFLDTEIGTALLTAVLSVGLSALPKGLGAGDLIPNLSHELRIASMARAGDAIADVVMGPLRQVAVMYIQGNAGGATYAELERGGSAPVLKVENLAAVTSPNG